MMKGINKPVHETVKRIPKNSVGVELGVWKGDSSKLFAKRASELHLVDAWSVEPYDNLENRDAYYERYADITGGTTPADFMKYYDRIHKDVVNRFVDSEHVKIHRMDTDAFFETFDRNVDWFYVDAAHDELGVYKDMVNAYNHLVKFGGGLIFGDDYGNKPGVVAGVDKFMAEHPELKLNNFYMNQFEIKVDVS